MLGRSIAINLAVKGYHTEKEISFSWDDTTQRAAQSPFIEQTIERRVESIKSSTKAETDIRTHVVWSAGKGGFGAVRQELEIELDAFKDVIALSEGVIIK